MPRWEAKVDKRAVEREVPAIFVGIEAALAAQGGDADKELEVLKKAFARYFTHHFADVTPKWKVSDATTKWLDLAVDAADS